MVDREDDLRVGVKSTAILFDDADTTIIGILHLIFLAVLILVGQQLDLDVFYYSAVFVVFILCIYHQYLINDRLPEKCFQAFLSNNYIGMIIFLGIFVSYL